MFTAYIFIPRAVAYHRSTKLSARCPATVQVQLIQHAADNVRMTTKSFALTAAWAASLAYAAGMKRLGRGHLANVVLAVAERSDNAEVVMSGPWPTINRSAAASRGC